MLQIRSRGQRILIRDPLACRYAKLSENRIVDVRSSGYAPEYRPASLQTFVSRIGWLPRALFLGAVFREERWQRSIVKRHEENVDLAERFQGIRSDYERDGFEQMLWADCLEMGFEPSEIREFIDRPTAITSCLYVGMGMKPPVDIAKLYVELP